VLALRSNIRLLFVLALALGSCLALAPATSAKKAPHRSHKCLHTGAQAGQVSRRALANATLCLLNKQRALHHLKGLKMSKRLGHAARGHSVEMARVHYFSHNSYSGASFLDRIRRSGYLHLARRWSVGENIAWGTGGLSTPRSIVRAWMHSPGHRANILQPSFRHIGIGISFGAPVRIAARSAATYTTDFGMRG
jgi:uncharacterized protein YkwD